MKESSLLTSYLREASPSRCIVYLQGNTELDLDSALESGQSVLRRFLCQLIDFPKAPHRFDQRSFDRHRRDDSRSVRRCLRLQSFDVHRSLHSHGSISRRMFFADFSLVDGISSCEGSSSLQSSSDRPRGRRTRSDHSDPRRRPFRRTSGEDRRGDSFFASRKSLGEQSLAPTREPRTTPPGERRRTANPEGPLDERGVSPGHAQLQAEQIETVKRKIYSGRRRREVFRARGAVFFGLRVRILPFSGRTRG